MFKTGLVLTLMFGVMAITAPAEAQMNNGRQAQEQACGRDVNRYCRRFIQDGDFVILRCLQENRHRLTRACRSMLEAHGR